MVERSDKVLISTAESKGLAGASSFGWQLSANVSPGKAASAGSTSLAFSPSQSCCCRNMESETIENKNKEVEICVYPIL